MCNPTDITENNNTNALFIITHKIKILKIKNCVSNEIFGLFKCKMVGSSQEEGRQPSESKTEK